ncbi:MAG: hypothetical protein EXR59_05060 [Dehalococcoidia bacterium]|nr:hypothetical protein [Dehalococcoidia bacterium]
MEVESVATVFLFSKDLKKSVDFYSTLLGVGPSSGWADMMSAFQIGDTTLRIHSDKNAAWLPVHAKRGLGFALHFKVKSVDEQWERLNKLKFPLPEKPEILHTGIKKFAMKDPDGYEVEFVQLSEAVH